jgi:hypothetical protein
MNREELRKKKEQESSRISRFVRAAAILAAGDKQYDHAHSTNEYDTNVTLKSLTFSLTTSKSSSAYMHYKCSVNVDKKKENMWYWSASVSAPNSVAMGIRNLRSEFPRMDKYSPDCRTAKVDFPVSEDDIKWAEAVLQEFGITQDSGPYRVIFTKEVTATKMVHVSHANSQEQAIEIAKQSHSIRSWSSEDDVEGYKSVAVTKLN